MENSKLVEWTVKFRKLEFIRVLQRTMLILFPIILIGSFAQFLSEGVFSANGYIGNLVKINQLPNYRFYRFIFRDVMNVSNNWLSPYAAMVSAFLTTKRHGYEGVLGALVALSSYVLLFYNGGNGTLVNNERYYGTSWFIVGVIFGYLVGKVFVKFGRDLWQNDNQNREKILEIILYDLRPVLLILIPVLIIHIIIKIFGFFGIDDNISQTVTAIVSQHSNYMLNIIISLVGTVVTWFGFPDVMSFSSRLYDNETLSNLTYALTHKRNWGIPYPFTPSALYNGFAKFGGLGVSLALLIAILWVSRRKYMRRMADLTAVPVFFNIPGALTFGIGLTLNPIYVIPFVLLPIMNIVLASVVIYFHVIPPIVYPVPNGTPGILVPLIGTGGNIYAFIFSILLLILDVMVYIPFVKLADIVDDQLLVDERGDQHA
ncbi:PTS system cellobiose-specific IIC component [Lactobacillus colini]|uniref:PTS system cellobiose-specific IIC component n=1 Tax=Lactobacillus colini TaxID=1819254 RepID=A0ABS4MGF6_9LACO|nr:PTS sugar transporter subunit IIC [Lactobacillus colini]MBP2058777.1 PTS system cellobiose-specific IIC component [Lactobacillus colini]